MLNLIVSMSFYIVVIHFIQKKILKIGKYNLGMVNNENMSMNVLRSE